MSSGDQVLVPGLLWVGWKIEFEHVSVFVRHGLLLASEREEGDVTGWLWQFLSGLWESQGQRLCNPSVEMLRLMKRELSAALL